MNYPNKKYIDYTAKGVNPTDGVIDQYINKSWQAARNDALSMYDRRYINIEIIKSDDDNVVASWKIVNGQLVRCTSQTAHNN